MNYVIFASRLTIDLDCFRVPPSTLIQQKIIIPRNESKFISIKMSREIKILRKPQSFISQQISSEISIFYDLYNHENDVKLRYVVQFAQDVPPNVYKHKSR